MRTVLESTHSDQSLVNNASAKQKKKKKKKNKKKKKTSDLVPGNEQS